VIVDPCPKILPASITIAVDVALVADRLPAIMILPVVVSISILAVARPLDSMPPIETVPNVNDLELLRTRFPTTPDVAIVEMLLAMFGRVRSPSPRITNP